MPTTKPQNYTSKMVATMRELYEKATDQTSRDKAVNEVAEQFGKSPRSIISKMSREGFYVPKVTVSKVTGEKPAKKEELAETLRSVSGLPMVSAEKLNKTDIQDLIEHFKMYNEVPAEFAEVEQETAEQD